MEWCIANFKNKIEAILDNGINCGDLTYSIMNVNAMKVLQNEYEGLGTMNDNWT